MGVRWPARLRPRHESAWVWGTEGELATADLPALTDRIYGGKFQLWEHGSGITGYYAFALPGKQQDSGYVHVLAAAHLDLAPRHLGRQHCRPSWSLGGRSTRPTMSR